MSIKSDKWIRRMCEEHGMIDPYEPHQVKELDGRRVISFGTSSYGYDIRCSREFKIFTNVYSAIVDPKAFDDKSFVDHVGDTCIIPPNSFALARTVEYFRIPRSVLTICLGKSTYARCFRGDTRVALVDGTSATLEEMANRSERGEDFWGYSLAPFGRVIVTRLEAPRFIARDSLLEITLDNGVPIHCTPDHEFLRRDGTLAPADRLRPGDSLMPLYRDLFRGYEMVYQPINGHLHPTHRLADDWNLRHGIYADATGTHRHHVDRDRRNNRPWNIERMPAAEHIRMHNASSYGETFDAEEHSRAIRSALARLGADPEWRERYRLLQRNRALRFWTDEAFAATRAMILERRRNPSDETREAHRRATLERYRDPGERVRQAELMRRAWSHDDGSRRARQREVARRIRLRGEIDEETVRTALNETGSIRGAARAIGCDRSVFRRFPEVVAAFRGRRGKNHKVSSVKTLSGEHDVYCLTVPEAGNFALEAGVFVRNCGLIVNVTPLEPEWEGHVTLEFSNTTPLPAKIYANEGVAQVLFFESDEVCETSYKDRSGKYQGQRGVTLPKA
ncbi:MAG: dCTP deaminase [Deltaproteobacteria bacterium]|nr:dCTP deaminase [Deltaproteobacteria bacterium]